MINELLVPLNHELLDNFKDLNNDIERDRDHVGVSHPEDKHRDEKGRLPVLIALDVLEITIIKSPVLREGRQQNNENEL